MNKINGSYIVMTKEIRLLFKSKRRIMLLFMMPIIILVGGLIISATIYFADDTLDLTHIWVVDESNGEYSKDLITLWSTINNTKLEEITTDYFELQESLEFDVLVLIPNNYSSLFAANQTAKLFISYNTNETINRNVALSILQLTEIYDLSLVLDQNPDVQFNLIDAGIQEVSGDKDAVDEEIAQVLVIIPVYIIFFVVISPVSLVLISVTIEREQKTLEVLFLQPVKRRAIVMGKILYGLFLVFATLIMDVIAVLITAFLVTTAISAKGISDDGFSFDSISEAVQVEEIIMFFLGIATIAVFIISLSVFLSLLAKDEKEANMISGIIPMLIMVMVVVIFVVPIADMGLVGQTLFSITPILGIIVTIFLSTLAGGVVPLTYVAILAQLFWSALIIAMTARISEAESILELSYGKAFKELKNAIFRRKK